MKKIEKLNIIIPMRHGEDAINEIGNIVNKINEIIDAIDEVEYDLQICSKQS